LAALKAGESSKLSEKLELLTKMEVSQLYKYATAGIAILY